MFISIVIKPEQHWNFIASKQNLNANKVVAFISNSLHPLKLFAHGFAMLGGRLCAECMHQ